MPAKQPARQASQTELAKIFGVDRTTVRNWQNAGLPYLKAERGKSAVYIVPLAINWGIGYQVSRDPNMPAHARNLNGPIDPLALALSGDRLRGEHVDYAQVADWLAACGVKADTLQERVGYFMGAARPTPMLAAG